MKIMPRNPEIVKRFRPNDFAVISNGFIERNSGDIEAVAWTYKHAEILFQQFPRVTIILCIDDNRNTKWCTNLMQVDNFYNKKKREL